jgi:aminoglycoside 2''-phosphotransferase
VNKPVDYRNFITARYPQYQIFTCNTIQEGWSSLVLDVNDEYIFRFPRRPQVYPGLEKEIVLLPHLARALPVPTPQFEYLCSPGEGNDQPFAGYRKIPGVPLDRDLTGKPAISRQLGEILGILHGLALPWSVHRHLPLRSIFDWKRHYLDLYQQVSQLVLPLLTADMQTKSVALWEGFLRPRAHFRFEMALIHADLGPEHILCDPQTAGISGIIDWEDACVGDPALDFVGLLQVGGKEFVEQVLLAYPRDPGMNFWSRLDFYTKIVPFHEILFGLETDDETHLHNGLDELQRMLND